MKLYADQAIAEHEATLQRNIQLFNMAFRQIVNDLTTSTCKVVNVYGENTFNNIFIEVVDALVLHSWRDYFAFHPHADFSSIIFHAYSPHVVRKWSRKVFPNASSETPVKLFQSKPWNRASANNVNKAPSTSPTHRSRTRAPLPFVRLILKPRSCTATSSASSSLLSSIPSADAPDLSICYGSARNTPSCPHLSRDTHIQLAQALFDNVGKLTKAKPPTSGMRHYSCRYQKR